MLEKDLNRIIASSFKKKGFFSHKISDDAGQFQGTSKKPFDYLSVTNTYSYYGESKLLKPLKSFQFNLLQDHQHESLSLINSLKQKKAIPMVSVGVWESRKYFYVFFFHYNLIESLMKDGINSILKKQLELLLERDMFLSVTKSEIDVLCIEEKIVYNKWF